MNKMFVHKIKSQKGQGLMELIVAMAVIIVGLFSVWALFFSNFNGEQEAETRMIASNLAREGIEAVKNIRDSNWLAVENNVVNASWDNGFNNSGYYALGQLFSTSSSYVGSTTLTSITGPNALDTKLYINGDGFYDHVSSTGKVTPFSRFVAIKNICCISDDRFACNIPASSALSYKAVGVGCLPTEIKVGINLVSEVRWLATNKQPRKATLEEQLFNWR